MSPTIIYERGFRVVIFFNDHPPPHAHVLKDGKKARILLDPVELWDSEFKAKDTKFAVKLVEENHDKLIVKWQEIFGDSDDHETTDSNDTE